MAALPTPSAMQSSHTIAHQSLTSSSQLSQPSTQLSTSGANNSTMPPPAGSSPEVLFRFYLAAELRRIGSSADESIIDKYVAQHYDSFTKAMDKQTSSEQSKLHHNDTNIAMTPSQSQENYATQNAEDSIDAFRSSPPSGPSSAPYLLSNDAQVSQSIAPDMMEMSSVHQPFTVSRLPTTSDKQATPPVTASAHFSPMKRGKYRDTSADDDMSEDDDDKDTLADLVDDFKVSPINSASSSRSQNGGAAEETPIAGSIMGPANELRPDPEAYRKLSSKEKRQLRNKISARNFRTRRKEHIAHLEQQVADRDTIIEGLRQQLAQVNVHNNHLNEEIRILKTKSISNADVSRIIEALQKGAASSSTSAPTTNNEMGPPPSHLLRSSSNTSLSETFHNSGRPLTPSMIPSSPRSNSPHPLIARPNMRKDLPSSSSSNSSKSFWGGELGGASNNFMSVHTVLVPQAVNLSSIRGSNSTLKPLIKSHLPEEVKLSHLFTEKLDLTEHGGAETTKRANAKKEQEASINETFISLLEEDDIAPPSYSEAVTTDAPMDACRDEQMQSLILTALGKALSTSQSSSDSSAKVAPIATSSATRLDSSKLQALLDGRARLVLYDDSKGQIWNESSESNAVRCSSPVSETAVST
ncbi:hypothetical protein CBS101457_000495 [Exobasidium rhododendri]|nr:hypothetical protein CBS101457_000495 [Exobasidium rhododendri]